jgi:NDP-sugar pyrophosphorylase family protein
MLRSYGTTALLVGLAFGIGMMAGRVTRVEAQGQGKVFELRTYTAPEGKLGALTARFRDHTVRIFNKHGMKSVGYWVPADAPQSQNTLVYILEHQSRDAAKKSWDAFRADPEWMKVAAETQKDGPIVSKVDSVYMSPTDFSAIK